MSATRKMWSDRFGSFPGGTIKEVFGFVKEFFGLICMGITVLLIGFFMWVYGPLQTGEPISSVRLKVLSFNSVCTQDAVRAFITEKQRAITELEVNQIRESCKVKDAYTKQLNVL